MGIGISFGFEQAFQASLVVGGEQADDCARFSLVRKLVQCLGYRGDEAGVGMAQYETQLGRDPQAGVGRARIIERPLQQLLDKIAGERSERRTLGAREHDHDRAAVGQAIVE
jgi:hypothetical protein